MNPTVPALTARWSDERRAEIIVEQDGQRRFVPADPQNADYRRLINGDGEIGQEPVEIGEPAEQS
jgi:hypothetical protein